MVYSYRSRPWILLNRSSDLSAVLEQIQSLPYEEPSGNAMGEEHCMAAQPHLLLAQPTVSIGAWEWQL